MSLSIGIVGLPNVGKSTLFNALTNNQADASNYPFCTIDPNVGIVKVPDFRLEELASISKSKKTIPTAIEFVDIAGLVKGAHEGEGLGNKFLANIRECDAICMVIRNFEDANINHVNGRIDPKDDKETIETELVLADLKSVEKRLEKASKEAKTNNKEALAVKAGLEKIFSHLSNGLPARTLVMDDDEKIQIKDLQLLTMKPMLYVMNTNDGREADIDFNDLKVIKLNIKQEEEISRLDDEEKKEYINELGLKESGLDKLVKASYELLGLITFFTSGEPETRAWTVQKGSLAPDAAGAIHTDFVKGFIRAEIATFSDFINYGGWTGAKEVGKCRTEGKDYEVKDGDVCYFLVNK